MMTCHDQWTPASELIPAGAVEDGKGRLSNLPTNSGKPGLLSM